jgi:hypothetical protein
VNSAPRLQTPGPAPPHTSGVCFFGALGPRIESAMDRQSKIEIMFVIGSSAALAAVAAFVMLLLAF